MFTTTSEFGVGGSDYKRWLWFYDCNYGCDCALICPFGIDYGIDYPITFCIGVVETGTDVLILGSSTEKTSLCNVGFEQHLNLNQYTSSIVTDYRKFYLPRLYDSDSIKNHVESRKLNWSLTNFETRTTRLLIKTTAAALVVSVPFKGQIVNLCCSSFEHAEVAAFAGPSWCWRGNRGEDAMSDCCRLDLVKTLTDRNKSQLVDKNGSPASIESINTTILLLSRESEVWPV